MGISHEYHSAHGRARRSRAGTGLRLAGVIAAILLLSLAVTAILENGTKESEQPQTATSSGMAENILAPLPMQGAAADSTAGESGETAADSGSAGSTADPGAAAVTLENFGPDGGRLHGQGARQQHHPPAQLRAGRPELFCGCSLPR